MSDKINELPLEIEVDDVSNGDIYTAEDTQEHEVQKNDTVDIQTSEDKPIIIEVEETMGWAGGDSGAHSSLYGRDEPDQHPISAITGLSEKLSDIEALKPIQSNQFGFANYYKWANDESRREYGYFVSFIPHSETITICNGRDIFGVTVPLAGFVGGQNEVKRGDDYALVATTGLVDVRCKSTVSEGDYVVSNADGVATKTDSGYGYKVIAIEDKHGVFYASISLGVQACVTDTIGKKLQHLDGRMGDAEANIAAAMNTANEAYNKATESISSNTSMSNQIADALVKVDDMSTNIDNIGAQVSDISAISAQAKTIATDAVISAESARNEAVAKANEALDKSGEIEKTVEPISRWEYTDPVTGETNTGATYFVEYVKNSLVTKAEMETVSKLGKENKLLIEKNAENYTQMLSSIDKYSIGEYSQAYGLTADQAKNILKVGMIYIPTINHKEPLFANGETEFLRNALYMWNGSSWGSETLNSVWLGSDNPGSSYQYWYTELDEAAEGYKPHTLYINNDGKWVEVSTLAGNVNNRITSMIRQDIDSVTIEVENAKGNFASIDARISDNETNISNIAAWVEQGGSNISAIEQSADEHGATMALVVAHNEETKMVSGASIVLGTGNNPSYISISADAINLEGVITANGTFQINTDGSMTATGGSIGGLTIQEGGITYGSKTDINMQTYSGFYIGPHGIEVSNGVKSNDDGTFYYPHVTINVEDGSLYADNANISGTISTGDLTATGGSIGGWKISSNQIAGSNIYLNTSDSYTYASLVPLSNTSSIRIGHGNPGTPYLSNFLLLDDGSLYAKYTKLYGGTIGSSLYPFVIGSGSDSANSPCIYSRSSAFAGNGGLGIISDNCVYIGGDGFSYWVGSESSHDYNTSIRPGFVFCSGDKSGTQNANTSVIYTNDGISFCYGGATNLRTTDNVLKYTKVSMNIRPDDLYVKGTITGDTSGSIISDRNKKNSISVFTDEYDKLFDDLLPVKYKYNYGTSNRFHSGFIAQDVVQAIIDSGLTTQDFAAYVETKDLNGETICAIRYEEFIALNTWQIQKLKNRISELEVIVDKLQEK